MATLNHGAPLASADLERQRGYSSLAGLVAAAPTAVAARQQT